jgi:hypothetical protein
MIFLAKTSGLTKNVMWKKIMMLDARIRCETPTVLEAITVAIRALEAPQIVNQNMKKGVLSVWKSSARNETTTWLTIPYPAMLQA